MEGGLLSPEIKHDHGYKVLEAVKISEIDEISALRLSDKTTLESASDLCLPNSPSWLAPFQATVDVRTLPASHVASDSSGQWASLTTGSWVSSLGSEPLPSLILTYHRYWPDPTRERCIPQIFGKEASILSSP